MSESMSERICKLCKQDIEDEIYFVCPELDCIQPKYSNVLNRVDMSSLIYKFEEIMCNANKNL